MLGEYEYAISTLIAGTSFAYVVQIRDASYSRLSDAGWELLPQLYAKLPNQAQIIEDYAKTNPLAKGGRAVPVRPGSKHSLSLFTDAGEQGDMDYAVGHGADQCS